VTAAARLTTDLSAVTAEALAGFFSGWPDPPSPETHLRILRGSAVAVVALDEEGAVVGFVTALSDGVLSACVPLLEVRADWRGRGLGRQLVQRVLAELDGIYMVDLVCDTDLEGFYAELGLRRLPLAMGVRDYQSQSGRPMK
jgi:GNAT superfamily N-acetyltransferase